MKHRDGKHCIKKKKSSVSLARKRMQQHQSPPSKIQRVLRHNNTGACHHTPSQSCATDTVMATPPAVHQQSPYVVVDGIRIRRNDGFFSATDMCKKFNKFWHEYERTKHAELYASAVKNEVQPEHQSDVVESNTVMGTWVRYIFSWVILPS